ncbi:iron chaperone [Aeromicrobium sp.]|uniref:iron chaperone n=1 Tax=Aeromicrobium sp. TaxID=1871063 RepID=UPI003C4D6DC6
MTSSTDDGDRQKFTTVEQYLEAALFDVEPRLAQTRRVIRETIPDADETISHNIPTYTQDGVVVVQFAGHADHTSLNFFPTAATFAHFGEELGTYRTSKSAVRFPVDQPLPVDLIAAITRFRAGEAAEYAARKRSGR